MRRVRARSPSVVEVTSGPLSPSRPSVWNSNVDDSGPIPLGKLDGVLRRARVESAWDGRKDSVDSVPAAPQARQASAPRHKRSSVKRVSALDAAAVRTAARPRLSSAGSVHPQPSVDGRYNKRQWLAPTCASSPLTFCRLKCGDNIKLHGGGMRQTVAAKGICRSVSGGAGGDQVSQVPVGGCTCASTSLAPFLTCLSRHRIAGVVTRSCCQQMCFTTCSYPRIVVEVRRMSRRR